MLIQHAHASFSISHWELQTPGGHTIGSTDPYQQQHGCALRTNDKIHVSNITKWTYHQGYITGTCDKGRFIFNEATTETQFFPDEQALNTAINSQNIGPPTTIQINPEYGYVFSQQWPHLMKRQVEYWIATWLNDLNDEQRAQLARQMQTDVGELHTKLFIDVVNTYQPAFYSDKNTSLIIAGQDDLQAAVHSILDSANQIRNTHKPIPPFIQFLIQLYAHPSMLNYKPPANESPFKHASKIHFCQRILQEHLHPSPPSPYSLLPGHLREKSAAIAQPLVNDLQLIRSQLELAQIQHNGHYPDLCQRGWQVLTQTSGPGGDYPPGDRFGPYLQKPLANPWSPDGNPSSIATDKSAAWKYDDSTGSIIAVIALRQDQFELLKLKPYDAIRVDPKY